MIESIELGSSFWGLCLEAGKKYSQSVVKKFYVKMAAVDPHKCKESEPITLYLEKGGVEYVLCTLVPHKLNQQQLNLTFCEGEDINLYIKEKGSLHLTGYLELDDDNMICEEEEDYEEADEEIVMEGRKRKLKPEAAYRKKAKLEFIDDEAEECSEDDDDDETDDEDDFEEEAPKISQKQEKKTKKQNGIKKEKHETLAEKSAAEVTSDLRKNKNNKGKDSKDEAATEKLTKKTLKGGVIVEDIKVGHGPEAVNGKKMRMFYTGKLQNGKIFDSTKSGPPFDFKIGKREVIPGWDVGILGMRVGGKRKLTIPPAMGYGSSRMGGIPANSTLIFEVELKAVN